MNPPGDLRHLRRDRAALRGARPVIRFRSGKVAGIRGITDTGGVELSQFQTIIHTEVV
jgi:hypothetical protein